MARDRLRCGVAKFSQKSTHSGVSIHFRTWVPYLILLPTPSPTRGIFLVQDFCTTLYIYIYIYIYINKRYGAALELPVSSTAAPSRVVGTSAGSKEGEGQERPQTKLEQPVRGHDFPFILPFDPALVPTTLLGGAAVNLWVECTWCQRPIFLFFWRKKKPKPVLCKNHEVYKLKIFERLKIVNVETLFPKSKLKYICEVRFGLHPFLRIMVLINSSRFCFVKEKFYIANFSIDNSVEIVSANWITEKGTKCYWPVNSSQRRKYVLRGTLPDPQSTDWTLLKCRILHHGEGCGK